MQININSSLFVGHNLITLKEVDSTNTYAKHILANIKPLAEGTVIVAEHQYAGKGQAENIWLSNAGENITASIILTPTFLSPSEQFDLSKMISLALRDLLTEIGVKDVTIKWPNDVYVGSQKIAGILIENMLQGSSIRHSIIGIGLNVNQQDFGQLNATSVSLQLKEIIHLEKLFSLIFKHVEARYLQLRAGKKGNIHREYIQTLYQINQLCLYKNTAGEVFYGTLKGVNKEGKLLVEIDNKEVSYGMKEIQFT